MNLIEVKPEQINPIKLSLVSFGSLGGMSMGLLLSLIITSTMFKVILAIILFSLSVYLIVKHIHLLL